MLRFAERKILDWYENDSRKPLVLRGARQVGKSTLVRNFCQNHKLNLVEINLEKNKLFSLEKNLNIEVILEEIEMISKKNISSPNTVLFIDEIQEQPTALTALRYFYEERPNLPIIAAGSLLEFVLNDKAISVPVGRIEYLKLGPMTFAEFLYAINENKLADITLSGKKVNQGPHEKLFELLKKYYFIGGMPEAVKVYAETKSLLKVRKVQSNIIKAYREDFLKYTKGMQYQRVARVFDYIPFNLGRKVKFSNIDSDFKSRDLKVAIELLRHARVALSATHSNCSGLPISGQKDESVFKLYFLDLGLACAIQDISWDALLSDKELISKGALAEQFVAQHLSCSEFNLISDELFYWLKDKDISKAEVDFVIQLGTELIPIEVKSEKSGRLRSLLQFVKEKKSKYCIKISTEELQLTEMPNSTSKLLTVPLYSIETLEILCEEYCR